MIEPDVGFEAHDVLLGGRGRITIGSNKRHRYGVSEDDAVHVTVETDDGAQFTCYALRVDDSGRVRIPHRLREFYGLVDGEEYLDVEIEPTGQQYEP